MCASRVAGNDYASLQNSCAHAEQETLDCLYEVTVTSHLHDPDRCPLLVRGRAVEATFIFFSWNKNDKDTK
tara:strand:- start:308 stop:520 length:213 start_codon:yes stop_codon:yes gene_type:complete